jgi:hypothetical protein
MSDSAIRSLFTMLALIVLGVNTINVVMDGVQLVNIAIAVPSLAWLTYLADREQPEHARAGYLACLFFWTVLGLGFSLYLAEPWTAYLPTEAVPAVADTVKASMALLTVRAVVHEPVTAWSACGTHKEVVNNLRHHVFVTHPGGVEFEELAERLGCKYVDVNAHGAYAFRPEPGCTDIYGTVLVVDAPMGSPIYNIVMRTELFMANDLTMSQRDALQRAFDMENESGELDNVQYIIPERRA